MAIATERHPIIVTHDGGVKFTAQVRSHHVVVDQPIRAGGDDSAPTPLELLGAALGSCVALYVQQFCHVRGLPYKDMRVEVETTAATNPNRIARFVVHVVLPTDLPDEYSEIIERVARNCPVHHTLAHGALVDFDFPVNAAVA
jgi:putative redox protein